MILETYWMGRDKANPPDDETRKNAADLVGRINMLAKELPFPLPSMTSGYRPAAINAAVGGAKKSNHMTGNAIDLADADGKLDAWCMANLDILERLGLWLEHPDATPTWCHLQRVAPRSKNRVFRP